MGKRYIVRWNDEERQQLQALVRTGKAVADKIKHANILLHIDLNGQGWSDQQAATAFQCDCNTIVNLRQRFVEPGLTAALEGKPSQTAPRQRVCDGEAEAKLMA